MCYFGFTAVNTGKCPLSLCCACTARPHTVTLALARAYLLDDEPEYHILHLNGHSGGVIAPGIVFAGSLGTGCLVL